MFQHLQSPLRWGWLEAKGVVAWWGLMSSVKPRLTHLAGTPCTCWKARMTTQKMRIPPAEGAPRDKNGREWEISKKMGPQVA